MYVAVYQFECVTMLLCEGSHHSVYLNAECTLVAPYSSSFFILYFWYESYLPFLSQMSKYSDAYKWIWFKRILLVSQHAKTCIKGILWEDLVCYNTIHYSSNTYYDAIQCITIKYLPYILMYTSTLSVKTSAFF